MSTFRLLTIGLLLLTTCYCWGQTYNPLLPNSYRNNYNNPQNRYDYEQFLLQQQQSELLVGQDSLELIKKTVNTDPEELRKLGVSEEFIEELLQLNAVSDSLNYLGLDVLREREKDDSLSIEDLQELISFQKDELLRKALALPEVKIYGQEFFRKNIVHLFDQQSVGRKAPDDYVLGIGDEINITIWGRNDVSNKYKVDPEGAINPKIVGKIYLQGLTLMQAKEAVRQRFENVYGQDANIEITLNYAEIITVNLVGELFNPGAYTFSSANSAFNALVSIDGPNQLGSLRNIHLKRNGREVATLDVYEYLLNPESQNNYFLQSNDYIFVPSQGSVVKIDGAIRRPHQYEMKEGESLADLIKYAGGLTAKAYTENVSVRRYEKNTERFLEISLDSLEANSQNFLLQNGDSIFIKNINPVLRNLVTITGAVRAPGSYTLRGGDKLSDILYRAGGPAENAALNKGFVFRVNRNLTREVIPFKVSEILVNQGADDNILMQKRDTIHLMALDSLRQEFPIYISGEVRNPGEYQYGKNLRLEDLVLLAGNFKREAAYSELEVSRILDMSQTGPEQGERIVVKRAKIGSNLAMDDEDASFVLMPHDRIFVRRSPNFEIQENVFLLGEVKYPGEYSLINKGERISSLIDRSGGFTEYAHRSAVKLKRLEQGPVLVDLEQVAKNPKSEYNYILADFDTIVVPKLKNFVTLKGELRYFVIDSIPQVNVPFEANKNANHYIQKYGGGFGKNGKKSNTFVQKANGEIERARGFWIVGKYPEVENGSTITVDATDRIKKQEEKIQLRKNRKFDWNRAIDSMASAMVTILTVVVLIVQLRSQ